MVAFNRSPVRAVVLGVIAAGGIFYELLQVRPPRWPLVAGYIVVIGLLIYGALDRSSSHDQRPKPV